MNAVDRLIERTVATKNPTVVGLDPDLAKIPRCYKKGVTATADPREAVASVIFAFNRDVIDTVAPYVPAVKPQMAFYEAYGHYGVKAFEDTVAYAKEKGFVVIEDAKRNDIGNTAKAYADGHLGTVELLDGTRAPSVNADFLTVTPYLGSESLRPFLSACVTYHKGVFILVKTSNSSSGEIQNAVTSQGVTVSRDLAQYVASQAESCLGHYGYSSIGAVVGATYPREAAALRALMPRSYFLVPGYGAQGGDAQDILPCFNPDGLGAIVNSSRGLLYTHVTDAEREACTREEYLSRVREEVRKMQTALYTALKSAYPNMVY